MLKCMLKVKLFEYNISQKDLADATGIRLPTISDYCNNKFKSISKDNVEKLCSYFCCDIGDLFKFENE